MLIFVCSIQLWCSPTYCNVSVHVFYHFMDKELFPCHIHVQLNLVWLDKKWSFRLCGFRKPMKPNISGWSVLKIMALTCKKWPWFCCPCNIIKINFVIWLIFHNDSDTEVFSLFCVLPGVFFWWPNFFFFPFLYK